MDIPGEAIVLICEKLAHNEVYLIGKEGDTIVYAVNRLGRVELKRAYFKEGKG